MGGHKYKVHTYNKKWVVKIVPPAYTKSFGHSPYRKRAPFPSFSLQYSTSCASAEEAVHT